MRFEYFAPDTYKWVSNYDYVSIQFNVLLSQTRYQDSKLQEFRESWPQTQGHMLCLDEHYCVSARECHSQWVTCKIMRITEWELFFLHLSNIITWSSPLNGKIKGGTGKHSCGRDCYLPKCVSSSSWKIGRQHFPVSIELKCNQEI